MCEKFHARLESLVQFFKRSWGFARGVLQKASWGFDQAVIRIASWGFGNRAWTFSGIARGVPVTLSWISPRGVFVHGASSTLLCLHQIIIVMLITLRSTLPLMVNPNHSAILTENSHHIAFTTHPRYVPMILTEDLYRAL